MPLRLQSGLVPWATSHSSGMPVSLQSAQDRAVAYAVDSINSITTQIADLNTQIAVAQASHAETESTLRDNRQKMLEKLSDLMDISYYEVESGSVTVTTKDGGLMVAGDQFIPLAATRLESAGNNGGRCMDSRSRPDSRS